MTSLRKQLIAWLLPLYVIAAIIATVCTYFMFGWSVRDFMDNQLRVFADSHVSSTGQIPALAPLTSMHTVKMGDMMVQIWDRDGHLLTTSCPDLPLTRQKTEGFQDVSINSQRWRVYSLHTPDRTVQSVQSIDFREYIIREQALRAGIPVASMIPISAIILWIAVTLALRRLELVAKAAAQQDEHSLGDLPTEHAPSEIRPLVRAVNTLLARLRDAFGTQRRFIQDAAHELRTPITAMCLQLENLKSRVTDKTTCDQVAQLEAGLGRTKRMVEQLLRLARQEVPNKPQAPAVIALGDLLKEIIADLMPLADRRDIDLGFSSSINATVNASSDDLRSLLHNLLDNALRYTPRGGVVDVTLHDDAGAVTVEIVDTGPGIPKELLPRVFDRFFRIEGTDSEGSGLGLAIARNAAERNGVELELCNRIDGSGLIARARFAALLVSREETAQPRATETA